MAFDSVQTFDPHESYSVVWRRLPHWAQAGTLCFITWRTADSMPKEVVEQWIKERNELLRRAGIVPNESESTITSPAWKQALARLPPAMRQSLLWSLTERFDFHLDSCHGACLLKRPALAEIVADSLKKFDGDRYELTGFVVMPNHVHLLAAFRDEESLLKQCTGWKRYTARRINELSGQRGEFWQEDMFDHLGRSEAHFEHYRRYIAQNGPKAKLREGEYLWYSKV
jgi:REP element-mobilizing transposase RayT